MIRLSLRGLYLLILLILAGCWNSKDIQNLDYATAIGIDYDFEKGEYITHVQVLNFSNVGRSENVEVGKPVPIWIGKGQGQTIAESLSSIYATSQMRIFWGHVKSIVFTENLLKEKVEEAYNAVHRFGDVRYNILIYGTKEKLSDIFVQKSIFNLSPLDTIMFSPEQIYAQRSSIVPIPGFKFIAQLREPGEPAMLPSLTINDTVWKEDKKSKPLLQINGAFFFAGTKMAAWLSEEELAGSRWTQKALKRSLINIPSEGKPSASLVLIKPHYKVKSGVESGKAWFDIHLKLDATLDELNENKSIRTIEEQAAEVVRKEIRSSFKKGLDKKVDVLRLEETLYRTHPKQWHELHRNQTFILKQESLRHINVKVHLINTGKYKGRIS
ncbi:Ger(x)C family spore germination protein [Cohnella sp. WQ 127256]|uniref:Ger(x)C family spore germination protein n=1 Tax=Cohnella sp. WQ 127256 TaxID=2938790 RepID=UPI002118A617|nr:Ger(x)C family spore germination protein [Cohnella sp. WQ 127256]